MVLASGEGEPEGIQLLIPTWSEIIWSSLIVAIIAFVFWKFLLPKFLAILDARTEKIEAGLNLAETMKAEAQEAAEENARLLAQARLESAGMREQARAEGAAILAEMRAHAVAEAERISLAAQRQIDAERQVALASLRLQVGDLAIELASKIVGEALDDEARQSRVVDRFLAEIEERELPSTAPGA